MDIKLFEFGTPEYRVLVYLLSAMQFELNGDSIMRDENLKPVFEYVNWH